MPRMEPLVGVTTPSELTASEPEKAEPVEEHALVPRQRALEPLAFPSHGVDESDSPPPEPVDWPMSISLGAQLDFASLGSIQVTISHFPVTGEVHGEYQSQTIALMSLTQAPLQLAQAQIPRSTWFWGGVLS